MDFGDSSFDDLTDSEQGAPPEERSNRNFIIIAGVLGAVAILAVICIVVYFLVQQPKNTALREQNKATLDAQNTEVAALVTSGIETDMMAEAIRNYTATPTITPIPDTPTPQPSPTAVLAIATTPAVPTLTLNPTQAFETAFSATRTSVVLTATANAPVASTPSATAIGGFGFADEVGLPTLLGVSVLLIVVIVLARRLRTA